MKISRRIVMAAAAAAMMAGASSAAMADLKVGIGAEPYPPFSSKDASGKWVGWEIDVMNAICAQINEKCQIVEVAWDGIIPALTSKQIDMIWNSLSITPERKQQVDFTHMYYNTPTVIIGSKTGDLDITPEHLKGKVLGAQIGTIHEKYVQKYYASAGVEVKTYATQDEANNDLAAGRLDYVQADASAMEAFLKTEQGTACCEMKGAVKDDPEILGEGVGGAVRKDDPQLKERLNTAIAELAKSGKFEEITKNYPELVGKLVLPK